MHGLLGLGTFFLKNAKNKITDIKAQKTVTKILSNNQF